MFPMLSGAHHVYVFFGRNPSSVSLYFFRVVNCSTLIIANVLSIFKCFEIFYWFVFPLNPLLTIEGFVLIALLKGRSVSRQCIG